MSDALKSIEEGKTRDGRRIIGFTIPIAIGLIAGCIAALTWLVYSDRNDHKVFSATLTRHVDPVDGGHETRAQLVERTLAKERTEARNEDWSNWRTAHTEESSAFFAEQRAFNKEANPRAASRAVAIIEAAEAPE